MMLLNFNQKKEEDAIELPIPRIESKDINIMEQTPTFTVGSI